MKIIFKTILFLILSLTAYKSAIAYNENPYPPEGSPEQVINNYISDYGKDPLIKAILSISGSETTTLRNGKFKDNNGYPNKNRVNAQTI